MPNSFSKEQQNKYQAYLKIHLNENQLLLSPHEQIPLVRKKMRRQWWMLAFNVVIILFFGYSFLDGITKLSETLFYILIGVFIINLGVIFYQKKKFNELIEYLCWKEKA